jgi:hypothetical protein
MKKIIKVFLVKSINENNTGEEAMTNLKLFTDTDEAQEFKRAIKRQIPHGSDAEWVAVEEFFLDIEININVVEDKIEVTV